MSGFTDVLTTLHLALQVLFVGVTCWLLIITATNWWRIRPALCSWRRGRLGGLPLAPTLFIVASVVFLFCTRVFDQQVSPFFYTGYLVGGACWFAASWLSATVFVTEQGLLQDVNSEKRLMAWEWVEDYFVVSLRRGRRVVFLYVDEDGTRHRNEVVVPAAHQARFQHVLKERIDARLELQASWAYDRMA